MGEYHKKTTNSQLLANLSPLLWRNATFWLVIKLISDNGNSFLGASRELTFVPNLLNQDTFENYLVENPIEKSYVPA